jgi:hypothetical protein
VVFSYVSWGICETSRIYSSTPKHLLDDEASKRGMEKSSVTNVRKSYFATIDEIVNVCVVVRGTSVLFGMNPAMKVRFHQKASL